MASLVSYGTAARRLLPHLRALVDTCTAELTFPEWARKKKVQAVVDAIAAIEASTEQPVLLQLTPR
jgi:hypothetical protein